MHQVAMALWLGFLLFYVVYSLILLLNLLIAMLSFTFDTVSDTHMHTCTHAHMHACTHTHIHACIA